MRIKHGSSMAARNQQRSSGVSAAWQHRGVTWRDAGISKTAAGVWHHSRRAAWQQRRRGGNHRHMAAAA